MITQPETERIDIPETLKNFDPDLQLEKYFQLLMEENKRINLVSRETSDADLKRLAAESLFPLRRIGGTVTRYLDIGSGGGFPAIPILFATKPETAILVERTQKKAAALGRILKSLEMKVDIRSQTYEECDFSEQFDLITIRFVKMTPKLLKSIRSHLASSGKLLYYSAPEFTLSGCTTFEFTVENNSIKKSYSIISN